MRGHHPEQRAINSVAVVFVRSVNSGPLHGSIDQATYRWFNGELDAAIGRIKP